jgi:hypothetical protein
MSVRRTRIHELRRRPGQEDEDDEFTFPGLHMLVAGMYLASGIEAALGERRGDFRVDDDLRLAPLTVAPMAALAHAARAILPGRPSRIAAQIMNGVAVAVGAAGLASSVASALVTPDDAFGPRRRRIRERIPALAPLAFGVTGLLGAVLDREERDETERHARLERRASIIQRLTRERRPRLDRVVVHV